MAEIYQKMSAVMSEIKAIGKDRKNPTQGYNFRGIDDVYNAVNQALIKHGVFPVPEILDVKREERKSKSGTVLVWTLVTVRYTFYAHDGSKVETVVIGEGMDSGDKSGNKAMSGAEKYAFLQIFCIPTEEPKDSENDSHEVASNGVSEQFTAFKDRIETVKNIFELKNWWTKHNKEMKEALSDKEYKMMVELKDKMKTIIETFQNEPEPETVEEPF